MLQNDVPSPRLRPATAADLLLYFEWANEEDVRARSFDDAPIPIDAHRAWFAKKLKSRNALMLVVEAPGPVGQIRFDVANDIAMIGFSVAAHARGRGLGSYMLRNGSVWFHAMFPNVRIARGLVKEDNVASRRAFEAAGFHLVPETADIRAPTVTYDIDLSLLATPVNAV